jgi:methionyl-tRNA formyltransferase
MINVLFMGRKTVSARALTWLIEQPGVNVVGVLTDSHLSVSPTREIANANGIPVLDREGMERQVSAGILKVDLALSMLYWQKIRMPLLQACPRGVINFHPAPLPEYRGTAGYNLAILESLDQWAVSAHYVDATIDTGALIEVSSFQIDVNHETAFSLERKTQPELLAQFIRVTRQALFSPSQLPTTPNVGGRYISRTEMEAMKEIRPGDNIMRKIRAFWFPPYDGAWVSVDGVRCTLVSSQILQALATPESSNLFTGPANAVLEIDRHN